MTDQYGANLERILRDIERRLQKLETAARTVRGIDFPDPPPPQTTPDIGGLDGLETPNAWPGTYDPTYGERVQNDLERFRLYMLAIRAGLVDADIFI
ncbi:hypothetical protein AB0K05_24975 [Nonomuraea sp. NPDC049486]|uniref:hypothetical protein n=1 Tax=Nonomuraea sp. NPDC049486 TaxID=3155773 RepID=UPI00343CD122